MHTIIVLVDDATLFGWRTKISSTRVLILVPFTVWLTVG